MSNYPYFNGQKWIAIQLGNFDDNVNPPPGSEFRITDDDEFRITDNDDRRVTD